MTRKRTLMLLAVVALASPAWGQDDKELSSVLQQADPPAATEPGGSAVTPTSPSTEPVTSSDSDGSAPAVAAKKPVANRFIEEVIVTAQKREENLQDVPVSIQAFSGDALDAKGVTSALDLPRLTPGMTYTALAGYSIVYIRGIGTDAFIPSADLSVPTYIDGIYFPFSSGLVQTFGALERIEILKGPQGTLFGRNTTGGAISVITRNPGREFEFSAQGSYANFHQLKARAYTAIPLTESVAISLSGVYSSEESYYRDLNAPIAPNFSKGGRLKLRWTPRDDLDVTLAGVVVNQEGSGTSNTQRVAVKPSVAVFGQMPTRDYETDVDEVSIDDVTSQVIYGSAKWATDWFDLKLLGSTQGITTEAQLDFDATTLPLAATYAPGGFGDIQTGELQLISNDSSWGAGWLTYTGGLYYIKSQAGYDPLYVKTGISNASTLPAIGAVAGSFLQTLLNQAGAATGVPISPARATVVGIIDTEASAAYLQGTGAITDWMSLTLGGRVQKETRALTKATVGVDGIPGTLISYAPRGVSSKNFSPKVTLDFRPTDGVLLYLSGAKGFKSGTYNIISLYTEPTFVKPENVTSYELGLKLDLLGGALRFNSAIFQNKTKDVQVQVISLTSGGAVQFENAGGARSRGAEFDMTWVPFTERLPGFVLTANGSYLDSTYTSFQNGSGFDEMTGLFFGKTSLVSPGRDFTGNRVVRTPKFSGSIGPSYSFEAGDGDVEVAADYYLNTGFFFSAQNTQVAKQDSYGILNARIAYLYRPWRTRLTLFGQNVTDSKYYLYQFENDFGTSGMLAAPAVYGVRLNWDF